MTVVDLWTVQIVRDTPAYEVLPPNVYELAEEMEENLTDLLPAGYRARIRRWDHPGTEEDDE